MRQFAAPAVWTVSSAPHVVWSAPFETHRTSVVLHYEVILQSAKHFLLSMQPQVDELGLLACQTLPYLNCLTIVALPFLLPLHPCWQCTLSECIAPLSALNASLCFFIFMLY